MISVQVCWFWALAVVTVLTLPATSQSVISTRSGIVHYFEGDVSVGDQPLESHPGKFSSIPQGSELRTGEGRAEVLLTPGVFLRVGGRSAIRMVANGLSDTRVELSAGSVIVDSAEPVGGTSVTLIYQKWKVHFLEQGRYRIDSNPPRMWVVEGKAEVLRNDERALLVEEGACLPFADVLVPDRTINLPIDALSKWQDGRQQSIAADNAIAANIEDPASLDSGGTTVSTVGGLTYFPPLYLPPAGLALSSLYGYQDSYQPGFNAVYLPGYRYLPLFFGISPVGYPPVRSPRYIGGHVPTFPPVRTPIGVQPVSVQPGHVLPPPGHSVSMIPGSVHAATSGGAHVAPHR